MLYIQRIFPKSYLSNDSEIHIRIIKKYNSIWSDVIFVLRWWISWFFMDWKNGNVVKAVQCFLCIAWVQPRFLFLKIYLFVFSKEYYVSCNDGHHRISINRYKNWHFVDIWNTTHIISFNKSTLDRKEGAIMNGQSRDIATLDPQGTKKRQPKHKNKTQKTKRHCRDQR